MSVRPLEAPRFVRRTQLGPNEYRKNFRQIDGDVITAITSQEAARVTPLMSKIYLRLVNAPAPCWEREGVLRFEGESREEGHVTAWEALCEVAGVASATASKALRWMHEQGVIGYFAGKNGAGIRVFINRATSSIGMRGTRQKILDFPRTSFEGGRASTDEAAFSDSFAVSEVSDTDLNSRAPVGAAGQTGVSKTASSRPPANLRDCSPGVEPQGQARMVTAAGVSVEEVVRRLGRELEGSLQAAARQAAAREHERTREWLESRGLPKAARVAQREAYNVLRQHVIVRERAQSTNAEVGRGYPADEHQPLSDGEVEELAGACIAMLEVKGQPVELTLSQMGADSGGFLPPADASRVRERVTALLRDSRR